jgi:phospholipase/carboxylesterase
MLHGTRRTPVCTNRVVAPNHTDGDNVEPMTQTLPECVEIPAPGEHRWSVIWLHGLGADGHDFEPIVPELRLPAALGVRFVFPHAPVRPVTINGGMPMRAWYDITGLGPGSAEDENGIRSSAEAVEELIAAEKERGVPAARIVLAGFSQGGAIALHAGLRHPERLAGIMGLSTYLPLQASFESERNPANNDTPIFMAHGRQDPMLPYELGDNSCRYLKGLGYDVEWHEYRMEHAVCMEEIRDIGTWLRRVLSL